MRRTPLKRGAPLTRGKPMKRSSMKRGKRKVRASDDPVHLAIIRSLDCARCQKPGPSEAHHPRDFTGAGLRAPDADAFPLCDRCHRSWLHDSGVPKEERRSFQREMVAKYRQFADYPVVLLAGNGSCWVAVGAYASDLEAERAWLSVDARGGGAIAWWGDRETAAKLLAGPHYVPEEAKSA